MVPLTFIGRMVQHVVPKGFQRVRYYGVQATKTGRVPVQSIGGSLRLPLLQNGAQFPFTPLLSMAMPVTHTCREMLFVLPGLRIMAMSM
jgi:hypothetical protein